MKENLKACIVENGISIRWYEGMGNNNKYKEVAHISYNRKLSYHVDDLPEEIKRVIEYFTKNGNMQRRSFQKDIKALVPLGYTEEQQTAIRSAWSKIAKEEIVVKVFQHSDDVYALGCETACLRLAYHFRKKDIRLAFSASLNSWYFVMYNDYKLF